MVLAYRSFSDNDCTNPVLPVDNTVGKTSVEVDFCEVSNDSIVDSTCNSDSGRPVRDRRPPERFGESYTFLMIF